MAGVHVMLGQTEALRRPFCGHTGKRDCGGDSGKVLSRRISMPIFTFVLYRRRLDACMVARPVHAGALARPAIMFIRHPMEEARGGQRRAVSSCLRNRATDCPKAYKRRRGVPVVLQALPLLCHTPLPRIGDTLLAVCIRPILCNLHLIRLLLYSLVARKELCIYPI